jgi:hypothetical protein
MNTDEGKSRNRKGDYKTTGQQDYGLLTTDYGLRDGRAENSGQRTEDRGQPRKGVRSRGDGEAVWKPYPVPPRLDRRRGGVVRWV